MNEIFKKYNDITTLEYYIEHGWDPYMGDAEEMYQKHILKQNKERQYVFITIQDFQTRMKDLDVLKEFINDCGHLYETGWWVIETGSKKEEKDFNIHIHMLVKIGKHVKNHKRDLDVAWKRYRNTSLYDKDFYLMKQFRESKKMPSYESWIKEKLEYFQNDKKTEEHQNTKDLGLCGTF